MRAHILDASSETLGRVASKAAALLMGKNRPDFERHVKEPVRLTIVNSDGIILTGKKWANKKYYRHSGYLGNLKEITAERMRRTDSRRLMRLAVVGMLPKNKLARKMVKNMEIHKGGRKAAKQK